MKSMEKFKKGDTVFFNGKMGKVLDMDFDEHKPHATTYKIRITEPFLMVFWVHNKSLSNTLTNGN